MKEIERRWLLGVLPPDFQHHPRSAIEQGYLAFDESGIEVRVRKRAGAACLTVKHKGSFVREEFNVPLSSELWDGLWALTAGRRLYKTRYEIPLGERVVEIDVYDGSNSGVVVAEVEFPDEQTALAFIAPPWFGEEITGSVRYSNPSMAVE